MRPIPIKEASPRPKPKKERPKTGLGIQSALLVFTCSSLVLVFAGGALAAVLFAAYAIFIR